MQIIILELLFDCIKINAFPIVDYYSHSNAIPFVMINLSKKREKIRMHR